ncbi:hypothetical protein CEXT_757341 [Caerostris extrusa]|uniref:Uncharacterized protein n=1 Tax=Caerostris extrusa TaxID=172846 RepID=A0AAV4NPH7_CAEEX|nr:hypothetical protein CEXT_757341 [Caerostris extrusa]
MYVAPHGNDHRECNKHKSKRISVSLCSWLDVNAVNRRCFNLILCSCHSIEITSDYSQITFWPKITQGQCSRGRERAPKGSCVVPDPGKCYQFDDDFGHEYGLVSDYGTTHYQ